jgi:hypothetical protein
VRKWKMRNGSCLGLITKLFVPRSFSIVDYKTQQAEFFLQKIQEAHHDFFAAQCFTDAFVSAARSITFSLQSVCKEIPGFENWYSEKQKILKADRLAEFCNKYRTASIHIGDTAIRGGTSKRDANGQVRVTYFFIETPDIPNPPTDDVYSACRNYFSALLQIILEAYRQFAPFIDDRWYFTAENFQKLGKTIQDALVEMGFPKNWLEIDAQISLEDRWKILRKTQTSGCQIDFLFEKYLNEHFSSPDEIE